MAKKIEYPDFIFESSWEVCNKVGGIYTVLSSRAKTMQEKKKDGVLFIGPDVWKEQQCPFFKEDKRVLRKWREAATADGLKVRCGRWTIPGEPMAVLVDFMPYYAQKDEIFSKMWEDYKVDSLHAYGDYDEASMFSYAAAKVVESYYKFEFTEKDKVVYHGNEWMCGLGLLYINKVLPKIGTVFTTHATSIGRSIAGNNKPLYEWLFAYNGDQMADELNMQSKHSIEKQTAAHVDCFTTVSDITAKECAELLDKPVDVVLPNGFDDSFVPQGAEFDKKRKEARQRLLDIANALTGASLDDNTLIVSTSGRYEWRNKGIDVFIEAMNRLRSAEGLKKKVLALIEVPAWVGEPRKDLVERLDSGMAYIDPLNDPFITHELHNYNEDKTIGMFRWLGINNAAKEQMIIVFIPSYLIGDDGVVNKPYYDVILGNDLCVYPSYYEPWGYTPLEAVAFHVPCVTTDLAGFGLWVNSVLGRYGEIEDGVKVIHRDDNNYDEVAEAIKDSVVKYSQMTKAQAESARKKAFAISKKALWEKFFKYYEKAYGIALSRASSRIDN